MQEKPNDLGLYKGLSRLVKTFVVCARTSGDRGLSTIL